MFVYRPHELEDFRSETPQARFRLVDGMLIIDLKQESIVDLQTVQRIEHFRKEMTFNLNVPVLVRIPNDYLLIDDDAFQYFGSAEAMEGCTAKALVVNAPLRVVLTNFSMKFYRQDKPFRLFTSRNEAKMWLFKQLDLDELMATTEQ